MDIKDIEDEVISHGKIITSLEVKNEHFDEKLDSIAIDIKTLISKQDMREKEFRDKLHDVRDNMVTNKSLIDILEDQQKIFEKIKIIESSVALATWIVANRRKLIGASLFIIGCLLVQSGIDAEIIKKLL